MEENKNEFTNEVTDETVSPEALVEESEITISEEEINEADLSAEEL